MTQVIKDKKTIDKIINEVKDIRLNLDVRNPFGRVYYEILTKNFLVSIGPYCAWTIADLPDSVESFCFHLKPSIWQMLKMYRIRRTLESKYNKLKQAEKEKTLRDISLLK